MLKDAYKMQTDMQTELTLALVLIAIVDGQMAILVVVIAAEIG